MSFSLSLHFLAVLSLQTSVYSTLKFYPVFLGHNKYKIVFSIVQKRTHGEPKLKSPWADLDDALASEAHTEILKDLPIPLRCLKVVFLTCL